MPRQPSFTIRLDPPMRSALEQLAQRRVRWEGQTISWASVIREAVDKLAAAELEAEGARRAKGAPKRASTTRASSAGRVRRAAGG